jgi:hypothetical protein
MVGKDFPNIRQCIWKNFLFFLSLFLPFLTKSIFLQVDLSSNGTFGWLAGENGGTMADSRSTHKLPQKTSTSTWGFPTKGELIIPQVFRAMRTIV